jgi:CheY-like chemotaxis protein/uncharacterized protein YjbJ (UPF0337 family)
MSRRPLIILQVEDTLTDVQLTAYAMKLGDIEHSMHVVSDGMQAIEFLTHSGRYITAPRPDLILLDVELPGRNGHEVLEFIKNEEELRTIPVIIFSNSESEESKQHAYQLHANSYVVKPTGMAAFTKTVQCIMDYWCNTSEEAAPALAGHVLRNNRGDLIMKDSTKDKVIGTMHELKGKVKEKAGRAKNDPALENEGTDEKIGGKIQKKVGEIEKVFEK